MKHIVKSALIVISLALLGSCTDYYNELNDDKDSPSETQPQYLFNYVIKEGAGDFGIVSSYNYNHFAPWAMQVSRSWGNSTMPPYTTFTQDNIQNLWNYFYGDLMLNCKVLENATKNDEALINQHNVARIWSIYCFHRVTDLWGDVPYSAAWKVMEVENEETRKPLYDKQEFIYASMLDVLNDAQSKLVNDTKMAFFADDFIFDGDISMWKKFANSLRLRLAIRSGNSAVAKEIIEAGNLISSNTETAYFEYLNIQDLWNPYYGLAQQGDEVLPKVSQLAIDYMNKDNDPRREKLAKANLYGFYLGYPNLVNEPAKEVRALANPFDLNPYGYSSLTTCYIGSYFTSTAEWKKPLISYAEICFLRSEAALRGYTSEDAVEWYKNGITASMLQLGVKQTAIDTYFGSVVINSVTIEDIISQKWIVLFLDGYEAFAEYRRTGFPQQKRWTMQIGDKDRIIAGTAKFIDVPRWYVPGRVPYPDTEELLNPDNYNAAVKRMSNGDTYYQQIWWSQKFGAVDYSQNNN